MGSNLGVITKDVKMVHTADMSGKRKKLLEKGKFLGLRNRRNMTSRTKVVQSKSWLSVERLIKISCTIGSDLHKNNT